MRTITYEGFRSLTHNFMEIGSVPTDEPCTQAGDNTADQKAECLALIDQIKRTHGEPPAGVDFCLIRNRHDFGTYYEAGVIFPDLAEEDEDGNEAQDHAALWEYLNKCEDLPDHWDEAARLFLTEAGHSKHQPARIIHLKTA